MVLYANIILLSLTWILDGNSAFPLTLTAQSGIHFKQQLFKDDFFPTTSSLGNVKFTASLDGLPDLPNWLTLEQEDSRSDCILHGTPGLTDVDTVKIEVIAWNKETYETIRKVQLLTVLPTVEVEYQLEFRVKNMDVTDFIKRSANLVQTVSKVWPNGDFVTLVEKASERKGEYYPVPGEKGDVFVVVGGNNPVPSDLLVLKPICNRIPPENEAASVFVEANWNIDWCSLQEVVRTENHENFESTDNYEPIALNTRTFDNKPEHMTADVAFIFLPLALGLSLIVILTCTVCFNNKQPRYARRNPKQSTVLISQNGQPTGLLYGQFDDETSGKPPPYKHPPNVNNHKLQNSKF